MKSKIQRDIKLKPQVLSLYSIDMNYQIVIEVTKHFQFLKLPHHELVTVCRWALARGPHFEYLWSVRSGCSEGRVCIRMDFGEGRP